MYISKLFLDGQHPFSFFFCSILTEMSRFWMCKKQNTDFNGAQMWYRTVFMPMLIIVKKINWKQGDEWTCQERKRTSDDGILSTSLFRLVGSIWLKHFTSDINNKCVVSGQKSINASANAWRNLVTSNVLLCRWKISWESFVKPRWSAANSGRRIYARRRWQKGKFLLSKITGWGTSVQI